MKINPDFISPCGLYCGVCAIYMAHRDNNQKFKEGLAGVYRGEVSGKGALPNSENISAEDIRCRGCLSDDLFMHCNQCEIRDCTNKINAMNFPVSILKIFPWLLGKRSFYGLSPIDGKWVLKNGFKMKKPVIFVLNAAIKFFVAL